MKFHSLILQIRITKSVFLRYHDENSSLLYNMLILEHFLVVFLKHFSKMISKCQCFPLNFVKPNRSPGSVCFDSIGSVRREHSWQENQEKGKPREGKTQFPLLSLLLSLFPKCCSLGVTQRQIKLLHNRIEFDKRNMQRFIHSNIIFG